MKKTTTSTGAPCCAPDGPHPAAQLVFRGATPLGAGVEGTSLSRVRTLTVATQDKATQTKGKGPAARGRPI